jgi:glucosamine-phosphate N-acetyltransferase
MTTPVTTLIQIRECKAEDFDSIVTLLDQLWPGKPLDPASLKRVYDRSLASDKQVYLCAVCDQRVVGFGSLTIKSNLWNEAFVGYVDEMVVDGAHQGRGIGTQILDHLVSLARERGCNRIELDSAFHRKDAHVFYERRGFQSRAFLYSKLL